MRRVVLLTLGWEELPKTVSIFGDTSGQRLVEPVPGVLLELDGGWLLLDTGFNPALIRDAALYRRFHGRHPEVRAVLPTPGEPLEEALEKAGLGVPSITAVALSHLHNDHAGGVRHFAGRVPIYVQKEELSYGFSEHPGPEEHGMFRVDYDDPSIDWRQLEGDCEIAPGVRAVFTPGHTPGHQSFVVDLDESVGGGGLVFAFDAADLQENLDREAAVGTFIGCGPERTVESIRHLKALALRLGYDIVPGHDPVAWPKWSAALAARFAC
ncbi:MAG TPA: N-acyl homoserine lactonase family protein [Acidimicrobiales bacterium]|nr:N-acyl homoserine lactonase family protein [Acidimicrobiales bacterium]